MKKPTTADMPDHKKRSPSPPRRNWPLNMAQRTAPKTKPAQQDAIGRMIQMEREDLGLVGSSDSPGHFAPQCRHTAANSATSLLHSRHGFRNTAKWEPTTSSPSSGQKKGRFNCCPRTTTLRRSGGGEGWFSCQQLSTFPTFAAVFAEEGCVINQPVPLCVANRLTSLIIH